MGTAFGIDYRISRHPLRQWQIGRLCVVAREFESQLWAASSSGRLKLSKAGKDYGSESEGREYIHREIWRESE